MLTFIIAIGAGLALAALAALWFYGRFAQLAPGAPSQALSSDALETDIDRQVAPLVAARDGKSGLTLLARNLDAFAARGLLARGAGRSLDLQYYAWKDDLAGRLLAMEVVRAADRGVRVRMLLDDINARGLDPRYLALDRHPNIEVRMFNPGRNRAGALGRAVELLLRAASLNRRMHNKAWIADGRVAIVGGRNIGDAYFDADRSSNFLDLDVLMVGPVVRQVEAVFDRYWNCALAIPIAALHPMRRRNMPAARRALERAATRAAARPYLLRLASASGVQDLLTGRFRVSWTDAVRILCDPPEKAQGQERERWMIRTIAPTLASAMRALRVISPYFVLRDQGVRLFGEIVGRGVGIFVLTNSLAATDVAAVHAGYAPHRKALLALGVRLFELKPHGRRHRMRLLGSSSASLHTKAFTIDGAAGFVGSFNFDPRSASLNTELGVLLHDADIVRELDAIFAEQTGADSSWRVWLDGAAVRWSDDDDTPPTIWTREPAAGFPRRLVSLILRQLPIDHLL